MRPSQILGLGPIRPGFETDAELEQKKSVSFAQPKKKFSLRKMPSRRRRPPRSRQEMRESALSSSTPSAGPAVSSPCQTTLPAAVAIAPVVLPPPPLTTGCLYAPYECSVYRFPPQWCSWCQVRAASMCAQLGQPDIRMVFRPTCPIPAAALGACQPPCFQPSMCPTSVATACSVPCPMPPCAPTPQPTCPVPQSCPVPSRSIGE